MSSFDKSYNGGFLENQGKYFAGVARNVSTHIKDNIIFPDENKNYHRDDSMSPVTAKEGITGREGNTPVDPGNFTHKERTIIIISVIISIVVICLFILLAVYLRYKYKIFKHQHTRQAAQDETYNMSMMSTYSATQPASFTTFTRPLPAVPKKDQEEEHYEEMIEFPPNERYSAAPSLLNKVNVLQNVERGTPDGDEEVGYLNPNKPDRRTYLMEDDQLLQVPSVSPPPIPGDESQINSRHSIKLPSRAPSSASTSSRPMKIWNAIWDDWYSKTGKEEARSSKRKH